MTDLKREMTSGAIGVSSSNFSAVHFANFRYTQIANQYALPPVRRRDAAGEAVSLSGRCPIRSTRRCWQALSRLDRAAQQRTWTTLSAEDSGITNLAEVIIDENGGNTVFARYIIDGRQGEQKLLSFGYSDKAQRLSERHSYI